MRLWITAASVAAILLPSTPVQARTMTHQSSGVVRHQHAVAGSRFVVVSRAGGNRVLVFDRFSQRFVAVPRHRFDHFGHRSDNLQGEDGFGGWGWWGWDGWPGAWTGGAVVASAEPTAAEFGALPVRPPRSPAELPPCHETTPVGVVIERGAGCAH